MGDVNLLTSSLQAALRGEPVDPSKLLRFVRRAKGVTANKVKAAGAALLFTEYELAAGDTIAALLDFEEANGPRAKEPLAPDSKAGIYSLAEVAIVTEGLASPKGHPTRRLAERQLALTGQRLAMSALIATPDGDVTGLPGVRSNDPAGPHRECETAEYREWHGIPHRGPGGRPRPLKRANPTSDDQAIFSAPAHWWHELLDGPVWCLSRYQVKRCPLPPALPLALVVYRWSGGTLAYFEDPGEPARRQWLTKGSHAANNDADRTEDVCSSVLVNWRTPGKHEVRAILSWRDEPPVGDVPAGAVRTRIPAVGERIEKEGVKNG